MIVTFKDPAVLRDNLRAALEAVGTDPIKSQVLVEVGPVARIVATDGHILWLNELACECPAGPKGPIGGAFALHAKDVELFSKYLKGTKRPVTITIEPDTQHAGDGSSVYAFNKEPLPLFPPYREVLPNPGDFGGERIVPCFDAQLFARVCRMFILASGTP